MGEINSKDNENFLIDKITEYYHKYLDRKPDKNGLDFYISEIKKNHLSLDDLPGIFSSSDEFRKNQKIKHACIYTKYGIKMYLHPVDIHISKSLNLNLIWEKEETEFFKNTIKKGMNIVDIGSNIGYFSLLFSKLVGQKGKIYSIEPDPINFKLLLKNIQANRAENVILFQKAVSNHNGHATLFLSEKNKGDHRIFDFHVFEDDTNRKSIDVECFKLDSLLSDSKKIDIIKMDIQGAEYLAIEGMNNIITKNPNIQLLTEFWPYGIEKSGHSPKEFIEQLTKIGFGIFIIKNNKLICFENEPLIENYGIKEHCNLICKKPQ